MTLNHIKFRIWLPIGYTPERCSEYCQLCALHDKLTALRILAANLAVGAGLCRSWELALDEFSFYGEGWFDDYAWRPGCGKPARGSEGGK